MKPRFFLLLPLLAVSCRSHVSPARPGLDRPERWPTNAEVLIYLEGKPLPLPRPGNLPLVVNLDGIEALSVARNGSATEEGAWSTPISFVYNTTRKRYTIDAVVEHRLVGDLRLFTALEIKRVGRR
jgi:hypothetical protein